MWRYSEIPQLAYILEASKINMSEIQNKEFQGERNVNFLEDSFR